MAAHSKSLQRRGLISDEAAERMSRRQTITVTMPLLIRLMEFAREDAKDDMALHEVVERVSNQSGVIDMDDYDELVRGL